jgi:phenylpropionate dioxygenase-like ring-hydroxylating dioxygenase large terminal subunit
MRDILLRDIWYFAAFARDIKPGKMQRIYICGDPIVLGRTQKGDVFALHDVCPHRAAMLSTGRQVEEDDGSTSVECPYHGWRMGVETGGCKHIPALVEDSKFEYQRLGAPAYPVAEIKGTIWIYIPEDPKRFDGKPALPPPTLANAVCDTPKMTVVAETEGPYDETVIGLVDPAHTTFVHQQWFWRRPKDAKEKIKHYEPSSLGFRMKAHPPSANARAYKLIGGALTTEIEFALPGLRYETIRNEKHTILSFTAITPHQEGHSSINHMVYWDMPLLSVVKPFIYPLAVRFLGQDGTILSEQNENLKRLDHKMKYVEDADRLAGWYMQTKQAYRQAREQDQPFVSPIEEATLRWRT